MYSRGHVSPPSSVVMQVNGNDLELSWAAQQESMYCRNTDLATVLVYNADKGKATGSVFETSWGELGCVIAIPAGFLGDDLHCYMSFSSADGKLVGDSRYLVIFR
ncbi:hypothetical protein FA047_12600 [Pedobacter frigoris]|uniref:Uncharacterized protein n=1 Tax=Pedobacter frigoris TaxID=2571272 RepID=A0A4U1CL41_9SPHI|nr:hypothetical protein FA047_12600 [Pedobacter frigoris]